MDDYGLKVEMTFGLWCHLLVTDPAFAAFDFDRATATRKQGRYPPWLSKFVQRVLNEPAAQRLGISWLDEQLALDALDRVLGLLAPLP